MSYQDAYRPVTGRLLAAAVALVVAAGCSGRPRTAQQVLARAVEAHGGERLSKWDTLTIKGTVKVDDGIMHTAAYLVYARQPDKLRVERDLTADRGRLFFEYFLNGRAAWGRRNLLPLTVERRQMQRWLNQCYGVAYYAKHGVSFSLKPDSEIRWEGASGAGDSKDNSAVTRPVYVVMVEAGNEIFDLFIDKETSYLLQESTEGVRRTFWDFKTFDGVVWPTTIREVTKDASGEVVTPFTFDTIQYNAPIEDWLFTEDMPVSNQEQ
jgi:hypothetical protein